MVVKIRMITNGPNGNYTPNEIIEVDEYRAGCLVGGGHAIYELETASVAPPENAMMERAKPRLVK